ncbi:activated RNA polymerase II transcriptional coactivator p15 [Nematostella vectensis]|uniref:activated RNA polymerase II transcriptional coactivator p15 n=1 Tax=Nematostella vectensis TaxID=45351 RepID=UPI0020771658|nr:activated RNA polymerase II transcriptional coactivator p15 [Nematostella vectensis]
MSKRPKSKVLVESSGSEEDSGSEQEEVKSKKKQKKEKPEASSSSGTKQDDGSYVFPLANKRQVTVRDFRGKVYVDIREFYEDKNSGDMKPGKKGISLPVDQWGKLKELIDDIDEAVSAM